MELIFVGLVAWFGGGIIGDAALGLFGMGGAAAQYRAQKQYAEAMKRRAAMTRPFPPPSQTKNPPAISD